MNLIIVGATARAAAYSALRAGMTPFAADYFSDRDLKAVATCVRLDNALKSDDPFPAFPKCPWIYTGPLENHPEFLDKLKRDRPLWGMAGSCLFSARSPSEVSNAMRFAGLNAPEVRGAKSADVPTDGSWLLKPGASAGGIGIERLLPGSESSDRHYVQKFIPGLRLSAVFVGNRYTATVAGITRQRIGVPGGEFVYRGSIGPWPIIDAVATQLTVAGNELAVRFGLVGLFGIDFILDDANRVWPVEVNPRYTASVEILELSQNRSLLDLHRRACLGEPFDETMPEPSRFVAKEVQFATRDGVFHHSGERLTEDPWEVPLIADVPEDGTEYKRGEPVLTVFAHSDTPESCHRALEAALDRRGF